MLVGLVAALATLERLALRVGHELNAHQEVARILATGSLERDPELGALHLWVGRKHVLD
jgi:hypothetical protein